MFPVGSLDQRITFNISKMYLDFMLEVVLVKPLYVTLNSLVFGQNNYINAQRRGGMLKQVERIQYNFPALVYFAHPNHQLHV